MTLNETIDEMYELSEVSITSDNVRYIIGKIYDNFESRNCKNCKWSGKWT